MASAGSGKKETISLFMTPMLDVFSILITFLLMSFSTDPVSHDVNPGIELPSSLTFVSLDEVPSIVVTKTDLLVNEKKVTTIVNGDIAEADRSQGAILPLHEELKKLAEANKRLAASREAEKKKPGVLTMEMDKAHKFVIARRVMLTAQQSEFVTFKLEASKEIQ